jgi:hypothetical protein
VLTITQTGRPQIICGRCAEETPLDSCVAVRWVNNRSLSCICIDCVERMTLYKLDHLPKFKAEPARAYFEALLDGRTRLQGLCV